MGAPALKDIGLESSLGSNKFHIWKSQFPLQFHSIATTVSGTSDFLNNTALQDKAILEYHKKVWQYLKPVHRYANTFFGDMYVTPSGMIAAAHLAGAGSVIKFLQSEGKKVATDANCVPLTHYMFCLGNKDVTAVIGSAGKPSASASSGKMYDLKQPDIDFYIAF